MKTRSSDAPLASAPLCPACGLKLDAWTSVDHENEPSPGDFSICTYCLEPLAFTEAMKLRRQTRRERVAFMAMPETQAAYFALSKLWKKGGRRIQ